ncbi:MAG: type II toxin-antitoxin system RelE/ParE family toxin [Nitrospira sp.]|nr:type II toxin-antitoxin system RelE/ParE family toxin [Nitrospira sp.]
MRRYHARYTPDVASRIRKLHPQIKTAIRQGIRGLLESPLAGHPLHFDLDGFRSFRVRNYRSIYRVNDDAGALEIVFVGARRTVYEELQALLRKQNHRE